MRSWRKSSGISRADCFVSCAAALEIQQNTESLEADANERGSRIFTLENEMIVGQFSRHTSNAGSDSGVGGHHGVHGSI
jgi:hypothetical protein